MVITKEQKWCRLYCKTLDEVEAAIKNKPFIHSQIILGVKRMLEFRSTTDMCLEIWCIETYSSVWISVRLNEAITALQKILDHREAEEEYEDCQEVVDLISAVELLILEKASSGPQDLKKLVK